MISMSNRPTRGENDAEREMQIKEIIARLDRLEAEAARLRAIAERLKATESTKT